MIEGKTPEITIEQARTLLASIRVAKTVTTKEGTDVETPLLVGLRDRAILATLEFTACRAGAVAKLRLGDFQNDGTQYVLRFQEKGGKSREIPVRHDLEGLYPRLSRRGGHRGREQGSAAVPLDGAADQATDRQPDDQQSDLRAGQAAAERCRAAGCGCRRTSFRVSAITDLLTQGVPLEDVQYLAGHAEPRTTGLYDRRQKKVTRNIVERISS